MIYYEYKRNSATSRRLVPQILAKKLTVTFGEGQLIFFIIIVVRLFNQDD